jgi:hypothetical protein
MPDGGGRFVMVASYGSSIRAKILGCTPVHKGIPLQALDMLPVDISLLSYTLDSGGRWVR